MFQGKLLHYLVIGTLLFYWYFIGTRCEQAVHKDGTGMVYPGMMHRYAIGSNGTNTVLWVLLQIGLPAVRQKIDWPRTPHQLFKEPSRAWHLACIQLGP